MLRRDIASSVSIGFVMRGFFTTLLFRCKRTFGVPIPPGLAAAAILTALAASAHTPGARARTLEVGPTRSLTNPAQAAAEARDGDRVIFDPGVYTACAIWPASRLTVEARARPAGMNPTILSEVIVTGTVCAGRALFYFTGNSIAVRGISFHDARSRDHTGAGILMEGDNLLVEDSRFINNQNGILAGGSPASVVRVVRSLFRDNGACLGQCAHALYLGQEIARLEVLNSDFQDTHVGHHIKSKARLTIVRDSTIQDGTKGNASYLIELPFGGDAQIVNNQLEKGQRAANREAAISIAAEGVRYPTAMLEIRGNRFVNDLPDSVRFVRNRTSFPARLIRNTIVGKVVPLEGPGTVE